MVRLAFESEFNFELSLTNEIGVRKFITKGKDDSKFFGLARIFSGSIKRGDTIKLHLIKKGDLA